MTPVAVDTRARRVALWHEIDYHAEQELVDVAAQLVHELERRDEEDAR